jgi:hypothetical protein
MKKKKNAQKVYTWNDDTNLTPSLIHEQVLLFIKHDINTPSTE